MKAARHDEIAKLKKDQEKKQAPSSERIEKDVKRAAQPANAFLLKTVGEISCSAGELKLRDFIT